jgi:ABC-type sugar transport system substrate-binding protein
VATATHNLQAYLATPTKINVTTPVKSPAPSGKLVISLGTSQSQNVQDQHAVQQAAKALGWNFAEISYDPANTATYQAALQTAIAKHPDFIQEAGMPASMISPAIMQQLRSNRIKFSTQASYPEVLNDTILANPDSFANTTLWGKIIGDYFVSHSGGKGNALVVHVPAYTILNGFTQGFQNVVSSLCSGCKTQTLNITLPQLAAGQTNSLVVSALRRNPDVNYLVYDDAPWADGVTQALSAAGLSKQVTIVGEGADPAAMAALRAGTEAAWTGYSGPYSTYQTMDAFVRAAEGLPSNTKEEDIQPTQLLTHENVGSISDWNAPSDALQQFLKLWKR